MNLSNLYERLRNCGIIITLNNGKLNVRAPQGALTPSLVQEIKSNKTDIIASLSHEATTQLHDDTIETFSPLPPKISSFPLANLNEHDLEIISKKVSGSFENIQDIYALSPLQEGMLFHHRMAVTGDPYLLLTITSFLNDNLLSKYITAIQKVIDRHDILRTGIHWKEISSPIQVVERNVKVIIEDIEINESDDAFIYLKNKFNSEYYRIEISKPPLLRFVRCYDKKNNRWLLAQILHHIIGDHTTLDVLNNEVITILSSGHSSLDHPQQYKSFIEHLKNSYDEKDITSFFKGQLSHITEPTLPFGWKENNFHTKKTIQSSITLSKELNSNIREYARHLGLSVATLCHLAWAIVVARTSGHQEALFGTVLLGRMNAGPGTEKAMGLFINTLPLYCQLKNHSVEQAARLVHHTLAHLLEYEHASLSIAQKNSGISASYPLFTALLNYRHNRPSAAERYTPQIESILNQVEELYSSEQTNYPFCMCIDDDQNSLTLTLQTYERFDADRICSYMQNALSGILTALRFTPDFPALSIDILSAAERRMLLEDWNRTDAAIPETTLPALFEAQAARTPDAVAVICNETSLTYAQLNVRANQIAHHLIRTGVKPEDRIALCTGRGIPMLAGMLGILKAGAAYVPLDPAYPSNRLALILTDADPKIVLTDTDGGSALGQEALNNRTIMLLDDNSAPWKNASPENPVTSLSPHNLAYVIYTSGSTGTPKGVMVEHAQVNRLFETTRHWFDFGPDDVLSLFHSYSFDFSIWEIWGALRHGGRLVIVPLTVAQSSEEFAQFIRHHGITILSQTPTVFQDLIHAIQKHGIPSSLRYVIFGGEALDPKILAPWYELTTDTAPLLVNMYGITETTVHVTYCPLSHADITKETSPVGVRLPDLRIYVLDAGGEPVPVGVAGELYVGGAGVARGYLNQPELTAERFLPDPFSPLPGARMYRTGDLACYQPDGTIIFLGRADDQIKIRGFRIEPGEIEARLTEQPTVRSAVVIAREDMPGDRRLVGYVIPETGQENCNPAELRRSLAARLPDYMVPAAIVMLDALPLTPNGKLDRRALPAPDYTPTSGRAPRSPQETALAALFAEILGVQDISAEASFFDMGGHSLLATRLISRIRDTLGLELPIRTLFEAPTVEALALRLTHNQETPRPPLTPLDRPSALPLSFAQQRLWFLYRLEGPSPTYNMPLTLQLRGELDLEALQASLQDMVSRHESLRTLFSETEDNARQEILTMDDPRCQLVLEQISATPDTLATQLSDLAARPFHLEQAIPVRATLLTLETDHHVLLILMHHIASDGWSMVPLMHDLATAYGARQQGETPVMAPLPVQYADYTLWQRTLLGDEQDATSRFSQQATYWQKTLAGLPECITLPTDRSRPAISSYRGDRIPLIIDAELTSRLKCLARQNGASLFMILQTGLAILLGKMGAGDDIAIGTPVAGRTDSALDSLVGFFINTLVLRVDLSRSPRVSQLIGQIRDRNLSAYAHQDLPFEKLVEILNPTRAQNHHPLFQVMLVLQNMDDTSVTLPGLDVSLAETEIFTAKFDLTVGLAEEGDRLCGSIEFATDLFDPETIAQLGKRFLRVLGKLTDSQDKPALSIDILSAAERRMLLEDWNRTDAAIPETTLPALFEAQAARTPDAVAVICNETSLTYAQLNVRANQIAHHLIRTGVKPEDRIALCTGRGIPMLAGMLGILKAGAAYVPLDPAYPSNRLALILTDADPKIVLTDTDGGSALGQEALNNRTIMLLDDNSAPWKNASPENPVTSLSPHNLAYVIYTSGSTGTPKGVMVEHAQVSASTLARLHTYKEHASPGSSSLLLSSYSFDSSIASIFGTLCQGSALHIISDTDSKDIAFIENYLRQYKITHILCVPRLLAMLDVALTPALRCGIMAGEEISTNDIHSLRQRNPNVMYYNEYGPTEGSVWATVHRCQENDTNTVPIGRPIESARIYVLDAGGEPVPVGVAGELYVGGAGVARGYLNQPELTAERFLPDPFSPLPGARMYRTGDLACYQPDGTIIFLGRADDQIKIRGFRIEPGEIEARLTEQPTVRSAVVIAREDMPGDRRLVGYVIPETGQENCNPAELRRSLAARLPDYMVPAAIVMLDALPLTPNGKLDRRALPAPDYTPTSGRAPRSPQETALAALFAEILGVQDISAEASFFDMGGHSLLATRLISRIRDTLGLELPIRTLFEAPTVEALALRLTHNQETPRPPLTPLDRPSALPLSFAQQRLWFLYRLEGPSPTYNMPLTLQLCGELDLEALQASLQDMVSRHESLRTLFSETEDNARQEILTMDDPRCQLVLEQISATPDTLAAQLSDLAARPFHLEQAIPVRATLLTLETDHHVLLILMHHIASDGWSMVPLMHDLATAYGARQQGETPVMAPLPVQYADYTLWQRTLLGDEQDATSRFSQQATYWQKTLAGLPECITLPTDRSRPAISSYRGDRIPLIIDAELTSRLKCLARQNGASLFMILQTGLAILLGKMGAGDDIAIGTPVAGRTDSALDSLVGFFINTLVLRVDLSRSPRVSQLIGQIRDRNLSAYAHQDLPFEKLVEILNPTRAQNHHPLFQVMLVLQNMDDTSVTLPGLDVSLAETEIFTAKFDLTVGLAEEGDRLCGSIEFATDLFDPETIAQLGKRFLRVLGKLTDSQDKPALSIDILSAAERRMLLEDWNRTDAAIPETTLPALFEAQAARTPDAVAVICNETSLTYAQLNVRANQIAHHLIRTGVKPEDRIALCTGRGIPMLAGMLGILKAGAAYVPLDPAYPSNRLALILTDADPKIVLTDTDGGSALGQEALNNRTIMLLDDNSAPWKNASPENPVTSLSPHNLAYVIYTSGSTGTPKGVMVEHAQVSASTLARLHTYKEHASPGSSSLLLSSYSFDSSIASIFGTLCQGSALHIISDTDSKDIAFIENYLRQYKITHILCVPRLLAMLDVALTPALRCGIMAGEEISTNDIHSLRQRNPNVMYYNEYGPTEGSVWATVHRCQENDTNTVPIGRPIESARIYVLDAGGEPVPVGVAGELYVGGAGVARGYLNQPELTAERFLPDPFSPLPGARMYRTGDLACYQPDGTIIFLGRADDQIKIRGFRIEPGEIEARLTEQPTVRSAVVIAREDMPGDRRLVGYVIPETGQENCNPAELRRSLAARLPDYMVPAAIVTLDALPLTPNGKLDRRALPAPDYTPTSGRAPRSPQETALTALFAEILGVQDISAEASFFDMGGHSLLATRLISRIRDTLGLELPIRTLFEAPTVEALALRLTHNQETPRPPLTPLDRPSALPLSFAQQRLWFLYRLEGPSPTYNMPLTLQLRGELDLEALQASLQDMVSRHESLRTLFSETEDNARQEILTMDDPRCQLVLEQISATPDTLATQLSDLAARPFHLEQAIPVRATLLTLETDHHVLLILMHHIASDGWSMVPLMHDLATAYGARQQGETPVMAPLPVQYADYTLWQRTLLGDEQDATSRFSQQATYWQKTLAGLPECITLPTDRSRPAISSYRGDRIPLIIDAELTSRLKCLAHQNGASLFMILQTGLAILLGKMGAGDDIAIGTPVAGRTDSALDSLVGFFINTLVLRVDLSRSPRVSQLIGQIRDRNLSAYAHQDLPFEKLVEILNPTRAQNHHPLFQVMLVLQNMDDTSVTLPGLDVSLAETEIFTAKFDLTVGLAEEGDRLCGSIEFATDLFDPETIAQLGKRFLRVLGKLTDSQDKPALSIDILSAAERRMLLEDWNRTDAAIPETTLPALFEAQAARTPDAVAVICNETSLTYAQLNVRANQIAHHLIRTGVKPEDRIALCTGRGIPMLAGMLGILKAGAAYVPLDPAYPSNRLALILTDADPKIVLTDTDGGSALGQEALNNRTIMLLDDNSAPWKNASPENPVTSLSPHNLAYVIYTSGSTGTPKGVMVEHAQVNRLFETTRHWFDFGPDDVLSLFHSYSFDFSIWEIWGALRHGGRLVIVPLTVAQSSEEFAQFIRHHGITILSQTPTVFQDLIHAIQKHGIPSSLRYVIFGGEALDPKILAPWYELTTDTAPLLVNMYGITETTVHVTYCPLSHADITKETSPVGVRLPDLRIYVLDAGGEPVPVGVAGELYVGGAGVARGYLNQPELTAERFLPDPFSPLPGARMYRTGDLACYQPDGTIIFLGRADDQIKIRGFRIEPGEIEARLTEQPTVRSAVVIAREDMPGDRRLVGYVIPETGQENCNPAELRRSLAARLPDYMVPAAIVMLDALPLTPNGKLDRRALPAPDYTPTSGRAPRSPQETALAALFAEILGVQDISAEASFFDMGGHSLLATRLISRIRDTLGLELPIRTLFEAPTVEALALRLTHNQETPRPPLTPLDRPSALPLSFAQQRLWFLYRLEGPSPTYNMPLTLQLRGELDLEALQASLQDMVSRHESLRTLFSETEDNARQEILTMDDPRCQLVLEQISATPDTLATQLSDLAARPFHLEQAIPVRATLLTLETDHHVLLILMHHIASDGWSMVPLMHDLATAYGARQQGETPVMAPLPVQYADYTLWQRTLLGDEQDATSRFSQQATYWQKTLAGLPECITLPTDRSRPAISSYRGDRIPLIIDAELTSRLKCLARQNGASLFMILQTGLAILLGKMGAGDDIAIGTPVAGRTDSALDSLVGFFINTLVLRVDLSRSPRVSQLIGQIRDRNLSAYAHQDLPFEKLVEILNPTRAQNHHPLFQVMLVLQNMDDTSVTLPGLDVSLAETEIFTAKFDLTVGLAEEGDRLCGSIEFATDLFDPETIAQLGKRFLRVLGKLTDSQDKPALSIDILSAAERRMLLEDWNRTDAAIPETTLPALFEAQAARTPDAVAVICNETSLTYAQLNVRANQIAHHLIRTGVKPEDRVGLYMMPSLDLIAAFLGIFKSAATYLPLDPKYSGERLKFIMKDSGVSYIIHDGEIPRINDLIEDNTKLISINEINFSEKTNKNLKIKLFNHSAYIIYTSGSSGNPKGVVVSNKNIINYIFSQKNRFGLSSETKTALISSINFDASICQIVSGIITGGKIFILSDDINHSLKKINKKGISITYLDVTPSILDNLSFDSVPRGSIINVGGEVIREESIKKWISTHKIFNSYGPTETTIDAIVSEQIMKTDIIPIGRPIVNVRAYILDTGGEPVPVGVAGELYVGGAGVARGYLNQPELTAERFLPDPFSPLPGARMYRTGDLACYQPDGTIIFLGRADDQIKIRGFRIEPGEIEARLTEQPTVRSAVVIAREDMPGDRRLVGYVIPETGQENCNPAELRRSLAARLPDYMVPAAIVMLDALPLTPNGKLDRRALPAPDYTPTSGRAPRSPQETALAALFAEILGVQDISAEASFFDMGGHSLLATRLISRIRDTLGLELPIRTLFEAPTVAALALRLTHNQEPLKNTDLICLRAGSSSMPIFCLPPAAGLIWSYFRLAQALPENSLMYAIQAPAIDSQEALEFSFIETVEYYVNTILKVISNSNYILLGWSSGAIFAFSVAHYMKKYDLSPSRLIMIDGYVEKDIICKDSISINYDEQLEKAEREIGLSSLSTDLKNKVKNALKSHDRMLNEFIPQIYDGPTTIIAAKAATRPVQDVVLHWKPYLNSLDEFVEIDEPHDNMFSPAGSQIISNIIRHHSPKF